MLKDFTKVSIKDSIATKLLKRVFGIYIIIAIIVTLIHIAVEYYYTKNSIIKELKTIYQTIENGLVLSLWDLDLEKTQSIINGGVILPSVTGISVEDDLGKIVGIAGNIYNKKKLLTETQGLINYFVWGKTKSAYVYSEDIIYILENKKVKIGCINIFSDSSTVFARIKVGFFFLIINSLIKSIALWIIFLFFSRKYIRHPLFTLTNATTQLNLDNLENISIDVQLPGNNEFKILEKCFNQMTAKLIDSRTHLQKLNNSLNTYKNHLELMVKERTKELRSANSNLEKEIENHKLTQKKLFQAKEEAEKNSEYKSEFLANMSHEIRTPMNAILGLTHLMLQTALNKKQVDFMNKINVSAGLLLRIINDILDFSKIESMKLDIENIPFNLDVVLENLSDIIIYKAEEKGLEVLFNIDPNVPCCLRGDALRLEQILTNLFSNAIKFTSKGEVILTANVIDQTEKKVFIEFKLKDTGIGMTKKEIEKLFQPFTQADGSITRKFGGTGLGLSICKNLVELMGGNIHVISEPGIGSTFIFNLPFEIDKYNNDKQQFILEECSEKHCLVVDDNEISRMIFIKTLESFKIQCKAVESGKKAIKELENTRVPYDLVILDWKMPEMDGIETAMKIKTNKHLIKTPKILMVSAYGREEIILRAKKVGLSSFLIKPVNRSVLFNAIIDIIGVNNMNNTCKNINLKTDEDEKALKKRRGANILVVEDNELNQEIVFELLNANDFNVFIAKDGFEAIDTVEKNNFDLVFMDIQMPNLDGLQATIKIRERGYKDLPIIAMTAHAMSGDREKSIEAGMNDHINKPVDPKKINETIIRWIPEKNKSEPKNISQRITSPSQKTLSASLPSSIPEISIENGLNCSNGNTDLFLRLLNKFCIYYSKKDLETLKTWLKNSENEHAKHWVHTLKGVAGNIGAENLFKASVALESDIKNDDVNIESNLEIFSKAYINLIDSLENLSILKEKKSNNYQKEKTNVKILREKFENLYNITQKRKPKPCKEIVNEIGGFELPENIEQDFKELRNYLEHYRFKQASIVIKGLLEKL